MSKKKQGKNDSPITEVLNAVNSLHTRGHYGINNPANTPALKGGKRDITHEAGYKEHLDFNDFLTAHKRTIGKVGNELIPNLAWTHPPKIKDGDSEDSQFCKEVEQLVKEHDLWDTLKRLQIYSRVYQYSGLIISAKESATTNANPNSPLKSMPKGIVKLMPVMQDRVQSYGVEKVSGQENFNSPRYGLPLHYNYREAVDSDTNHDSSSSFQLHPSRVYIYADNAPKSEIYGTPINEAGFNYILNIEKALAAAAEGYFKNAQQTPWVILDEQNSSKLRDPKVRKQWEEATEQAIAGISPQRLLVGGDVKTLQSSLADPTPYLEVQLKSYGATLGGIPVSSIVGHTLGERASGNDSDKLVGIATQYQQKECNKLINGFFKHLIEINAITPPNDEICIEWTDLSEPSKSDKVATAKTMAETNKIQADAQQQPIYSVEHFADILGIEIEEDEIDYKPEIEEE